MENRWAFFTVGGLGLLLALVLVWTLACNSPDASACLLLLPTFFLAGSLVRLLKERYSLTKYGIAVIVPIGLFAFQTGRFLALEMGGCKALAWMLALPVFLIFLQATFAVWGLVKMMPILGKLKKGESLLQKNEQEISELTRIEEQTDRINNRFEASLERVLEEKGRIGSEIKRMCLAGDDPRLFIMEKESRERSYAALSQGELGRLIKERDNRSIWNSRHLDILLLEKAFLSKRSQEIHERVAEAKETMDRQRSAIEALERNRTELREEADSYRSALENLKTGKVRLD